MNQLDCIELFPCPFPDESLESVIYRYHLLIGSNSETATSIAMFNAYRYPGSYNLEHVRVLVDKLYGVASGKFDLFLVNHTYYRLTKNFHLGDVSGSIRDGVWLIKSFGLSKFCPMCVRNDIEVFGVPYIHRSHQPSLVDFCWEHHAKLIEIKDRPVRGIYLCAKDFYQCLKEIANQEVETTSSKFQIRVANFVHKILNNHLPEIKRSDLVRAVEYKLWRSGKIKKKVGFSGRVPKKHRNRWVVDSLTKASVYRDLTELLPGSLSVSALLLAFFNSFEEFQLAILEAVKYRDISQVPGDVKNKSLVWFYRRHALALEGRRFNDETISQWLTVNDKEWHDEYLSVVSRIPPDKDYFKGCLDELKSFAYESTYISR
ncbi:MULTISPECIES: TniQ family protein [Pseudomonas]|uniref:TniQ family protein n=1 Tax=Pseudomonas TaxID=286 RepID=UPI000D529B88|nr:MULTISPECIES: TniQ family protein [Pseudomonas]